MKIVQIGGLTKLKKASILRNMPSHENSTHHFRVTTDKNLYVVIELFTVGLHEKTAKLLTPGGILFVYVENLVNA